MRKDLRAEFVRLSEEVKSSQINYLRTDLELGVSFAKMAMESGNEEKRVRVTRQARVAYDSVVRFLPRVALTETEHEDFGARLASLKSDLRLLGETF